MQEINRSIERDVETLAEDDHREGLAALVYRGEVGAFLDVMGEALPLDPDAILARLDAINDSVSLLLSQCLAHRRLDGGRDFNMLRLSLQATKNELTCAITSARKFRDIRRGNE